MTGRARTFGALRQRVRPRADRLVEQDPAKVVGQRSRRAVALRRVLLQRFRDDGVEIAASDGVGERGRRFDGVAGGMLAAQQHIQQHTERVDIGGRRHRSVGLEQFGDAEVEQLDAAVRR